MEVIIQTERLLLRVFDSGDVNDAKSFWGDDEVMINCLGAISYERLPKAIDSYINSHEKHGLSVYAVVDKSTDRVIGAAGFNVRNSLETVELIYHFSKDSWGKGFATESAIACVNIAKANGGVKKIYASADPLNGKSLKILEKIGFDYKGMKWFDDTNQEEPYFEMDLDQD